jgi:hypothetical protein
LQRVPLIAGHHMVVSSGTASISRISAPHNIQRIATRPGTE